MNWNDIWNNVSNYLLTSGLQILKAVIILVVGLFLVKLIMKIVRKIMAKTKLEKITQSLLCSVLKFGLNIVVIISTVQALGVDATSLIALISAAGLAISLSLQDSLSNLANGIILISTRPFKEGDYVQINGVEGTVQNVRMLTTCLATIDNKLVVIPNSNVVTNEIINYSARKERRVGFEFDIAYESDIELAKKIILDVMNSNGKILLDKTPFVSLKTLKESSLGIVANCWCDNEDYWSVYYYVMDNVYNEFKRHNISVPFNQLEVRLRNDDVIAPYRTESLPERIEKVREVEEKKNALTDFLFIPKKKKKSEKELQPKEIKENKEELKKAEEKLENKKEENK